MIGGNDSVKRGRVADFYADEASDVANLNQFGRDNKLSMGSTCYVIETGELYMMKSDFSWKKQ